MIAKPDHHEIRVVPKHEETIDGWRAFAVTAVKSDGRVIRWGLYERSPEPKRYARSLSYRPIAA